MSYFNGCHNLVMFISFVFVFIFVVRASEANPSSQYPWSRDELVHLAGYGEEKLSTVLVAGTLLCKACLPHQPQLHAWPIQGALVTINCPTKGKWSKQSSAEAVTDEYGDFLIDLPSHLHAIPNLDKTCSVKVVRVPNNSICKTPFVSVRKDKGLKLSSHGNGVRNYSAGNIELMHSTSKSLQACQKRISVVTRMEW